MIQQSSEDAAAALQHLAAAVPAAAAAGDLYTRAVVCCGSFASGISHQGLKLLNLIRQPHVCLQDVDEALKRMPQEVVDARNQRLKRAHDLNMKVAHVACLCAVEPRR